MAVRDKSAALDELGGDLERGEPLRGEKTTIDDSYLDGLSSKLDSEPKLVAPPPMPKPPGALPDDDDPLVDPPLGLASTGPVGKRRPPTNEELGSFDAKPIPSEPTQLEEEDELAGAATRIFIGDENAANAAQVEVLAGRDRGKVFVLSAETTCVGRGIDNDFILTDIASSRRHLKIHKRDGYYELEDLGSGNGTLRNGKKIPGRVVLLAGDKIELGNTTLVFAWDGTPPPGVLESTASLDMGSGTPPIPGHVPPGPRPATEQIARPRGASLAGTGSGPAAAAPAKGPNKVILFGGIGVGVLMILGIVIAKLATSTPATPTAAPAPSVTELQTMGVNAFAARQWDTALRAFEQLAAAAPNDPSIREYITRCQEERAAEQSLAQARLLGATSPRDAITALAAIPGQSVYAQEAASLRLEVTGRRVAEILRSVQSARQEPTPDVVRIMALVDEGLTLDSGNSELLAIRTELGSGLPGPSATTATGPGPSAPPGPGTPSVSGPDEPRGGGNRPPRGPRGGQAREPRPPREPPPTREPRPAPVATNAKVLQLFKSGRFREAADAASGIAETATGRAADQARSLARDIERFSTAWSGAQGGDGASKIRNLETALRLDRAISGGHYGSQIQPLLLRAHTDNATRAWQAGRYPSACQSVQAALRLDARNSTATSMSRNCVSKARDLYEQGYAMRTSNPDRARELWRQVLQMVSRDNEYYTRAYDRLNNSQSGSGRDEDE